MIADNLILIELVFGATLAFGFGFYQLWSVNREIERDKAAPKQESPAGAASRPGHPEGEHELDDR